MNKTQKKKVLGELETILGSSEAVFVTDFKGLSMVTLNQLRQKVRAAGGRFRVSKNTLVRLAAGDGRAQALNEVLTGNNALAFTDRDPAALAKALADFARDEEKFAIKSGLLKDQALSLAQIKSLANLPSREALLGAFLGTLGAIPTSLVRVLAGVPQKFLRVLVAVGEAKGGSPAAAPPSEA
jgi:large subunit ribosomal protein L10